MGNKRSNSSVPAGWSQQDRRFGESIKQNLDTLQGQRGDKLDRAVTFRDLLDAGIVKLAGGATNFDGRTSSVIVTTGIPNLEIPPAPTGLTAVGAFESIFLSWDLDLYRGHSGVEIWRHTSDSISSATMVAQVSGFTGVYGDQVGSNADFYYWVRAVNQNGVIGPYNSSTGVRGQTAVNVTFLLGALSSAITDSELANSLSTRIDLIDAADTVTNSVAYRVAQEASARATAIAAEATARATALSAEATARATALAAIVTGIPIYDSTEAYAVDQVVRISNTDSKLYICIQAVSANSSVAITDTAYWKLYGDYDSLKSSTDTSAAAITQINTVSSSSTSAAALALNGLNASVYVNGDPSQGLTLATSSALSAVQTEVFPNGTANASRLDTLDAEVFDPSGNSLLATASALGTVTTEVFPNGTASSSRLDTLDAEVFDSNGSRLATAAALGTVTAEVFPNGTANASRLDTLDAEVFDASGNSLLATASALGTVTTEVFPQGIASASRLDTLDAEVFAPDGGSLLATASAFNVVETEVFPQGTASASRLDTLDAEVFDSSGSRLATAAALSVVTGEVFPNGTASASRLDTLDATVYDANGTVQLATASALSTIETEVFPNGTSSASRLDALDNILFDPSTTPPTARVSASNLTTMKNQILDTNGNATATATQMTQLAASFTDPQGSTNTLSLQQALETSASEVDGLRGQYSVKIDNNGHVSGFGFNSTAVDGTPRSAFIVRADTFAIVDPTSTGNGLGTTTPSPDSVPFIYHDGTGLLNGETVPAGVYMKQTFIGDAQITNAKIKGLAADKIDAGFLNVTNRIDANSIAAGKLKIDTNILKEDSSTGNLLLVTSNGSNGIKVENLSNDAVGTVFFAESGSYVSIANQSSNIDPDDYTASTPFFEAPTPIVVFGSIVGYAGTTSLPQIFSADMSGTKIKETGAYTFDFGASINGQVSSFSTASDGQLMMEVFEAPSGSSSYSSHASRASVHYFGGNTPFGSFFTTATVNLVAGKNYRIRLYGYHRGISANSNSQLGWSNRFVRVFRINKST